MDEAETTAGPERQTIDTLLAVATADAVTQEALREMSAQLVTISGRLGRVEGHVEALLERVALLEKEAQTRA